MRPVWVGFLGAVLGAELSAQGARGVASYSPDHGVVAFQIRDLEGAGVSVLIEVDDRDRVRVGRMVGDGISWGTEELVLEDPEHSLLACADVMGDRSEELIVASRSGVMAYALTEGGGFVDRAVSLSRRARIQVRAGRPTFAPFVEDINDDGAVDLILPVGNGCEMWMRQPGNRERPSYRLVRTVQLSVGRSQQSASGRLSDVLQSEIIFPRLRLEDVNGDGRLDLLEGDGQRRSFYLQAADGSFADKPIQLDVGIFRDTTPEASVQPGKTLVANDNQHIQSGDLNGDGIPDYVIAHRRRVWVFIASEAGPQFTRPKRRRVAEDISGLLLADLNEDGRQDLVVAKVQLPSVASLVLGLISSMSIHVTALGYATGPEGDFSEEPTWRQELTIQIPALLSLMSEAEEMVERFEEILIKLRISVTGKFLPGEGGDLVMVSEAGNQLEIWREGGEVGEFFNQQGAYIRRILFDDSDPVFDIDRLFTIVSSIFDARTASLTGDRPADASFQMQDLDPYELEALLARDMDGDGLDEVVIVLQDPQDPENRSFRVVGWR